MRKQPHATLTTVLEELGLAQYEARSYVALLELGAGNGYVVAKHSGVPTAKVYEALASLVAKGFARSDGMQKPTYRAVPPDAALGAMRTSVQETIDHLLPPLRALTAEQPAFAARSLLGRAAVCRALRDVAGCARKKLLLTGWPLDLEAARSELTAIPKRCKVFVLSYGDFALPRARVFLHRRTDLVAKEHTGRWLIAAGDGCQAVAATFAQATKATGIWTSDEGLTRVLADHILHDISLNELMATLPPQAAAAAEKQLTTLRRTLYL